MKSIRQNNRDFIDHADDDLRFVGFDFETLTPKGRPPEPIELGALMLDRHLCLVADFCFEEFIKPPDEVRFTPFDTVQTGIKPADVDNAQTAGEILQRFDQKISPYSCILVAQNASYDFKILSRYRESVPFATSRPCLDVIKIAKHLYPDIPDYKLDTLAKITGISIPKNRHRALPDVDLMLKVFSTLLRSCFKKDIHSLRALVELGDITDWSTPKQLGLF